MTKTTAAEGSAALGTPAPNPAAEPPEGAPEAAETAQPAEPPAALSFAEFPVDQSIKDALADMGYERPTDVQAAVIGPANAGHDLLVQAKTGSGKTTAFGLPLLNRLQAGAAVPGVPKALILLPTRELAHQVAEELERLASHKDVRVMSLYGGVPIDRQVKTLAAGCEVVVATPGRLLDHVRRKTLRLDELSMVVLDEADEMLSMGFWDDVTELIRLSPKGRQTLLFSATLPYQVAKSAMQFMREPVRLDLSGDDLTVDGIDNRIVHVRDDMPKPRQMLYVLEGAFAKSAIIFCNTRNETDMLAKYLTRAGFAAEPISGNLKQKDRERTMARIKGGELRYMVATDIAARGIDITDLSHVFNYALPEFSEVYLHRVGRTGRNGKVGTAISLVDGRGLGTLTVLEKQFGIQFTEMTLPPEADVLRARSQRIMEELLEKAQVAEVSQLMPVAETVVGHGEAARVVAFLLKSYFQAQSGQQRAATSDDGPAEREERPRRGRSARGGDNQAAAAAEDSLAGQNEQALGGPADDESGRPRRRRRRGRGRAGNDEATPRGEEAPRHDRGAPTPRAAKHAFEVVDAIEWVNPEAARAREAEWLAAEEEAPPMRRPAQGESRGQGSREGRSRAPARPRQEAADAPAPKKAEAPPSAPLPAGQTRIRVNIGFNDGFKGRGAVAKKIASLAGLNEGILHELDSRREYALLRASHDIADLVLERVDGAQLGKKVIEVSLEPGKAAEGE